MSNRDRKIVSLAMYAMLGIALSGQSLAQVSQCDIERKTPGRTLDEVTYKRLNNIYEKVGEEDYNEAYEDLQSLLQRSGRDDYLKAIVYQGLAQVEWIRENFDAALNYFEKAVELDSLPNQAHFALMYQISQLYHMQERNDAALERLDLWFCKAPDEKITYAAYVLKASINAARKDYISALTAIEQAISMSEDPAETWFQLKLAAHFELEQYPQVAQTLETIITLWPDKKIYWIQLSQTYFRLKQDDKALAVVALAYRQNLLETQSDILYLSNLYSHLEVPYKAAEVLQTGLDAGVIEPSRKHWTICAESWYAAEELEKSLAAYEKAGKASLDGKIDLRRAYLLVDLERWSDAGAALIQALEKGGLNDRQTGEAHLLLGMSEFNMGNFDSASVSWGRAIRYSQTKASAQQWLNHMREERARKAS
jgi:tetratricopeptide (TPR) repeat protein